MRVINLSSGSDGNVTYLENDGVKVLIDAGLSAGEITKRLSLIGVAPNEIDAVFLTHDHIDHSKGIDVFSKKYDTPVFAHEKVWNTFDFKATRMSEKNRKLFSGEFSYKNLEVVPVEVPHDVDCFGFSFISNGKKISILTDLGHTNDRILSSIANSQLVYLEANYDKVMLKNSTKYPLAVKMRIGGPNGHLSNNASCDAIDFLARTGARQIVLSHLSKENNRPELAYEFMCQNLSPRGIVEGRDIRIDVASTQPGVFFRLK